MTEEKTVLEETPQAEEKVEEVKEKESEESEKDGSKQTQLVETEKYLNTGSHIGTKFKSGDMKKYIYKVRKDGLNVLDVQLLDQRLGFAAKFLAKFEPGKIAVVSRKVYGQVPVKVFSEVTGTIAITGRFVPGTFTNPESTRFIEPKAVLVTDPDVDNQAIEEATKMRIPVVALASTSTLLKNVDIAVPINNKGKKSMALAYWILAKEIMKERGEIKSDAELSKKPDDFEYKLKDEEEKKTFEKKPRWGRFRNNQGSRGKR